MAHVHVHDPADRAAARGDAAAGWLDRIAIAISGLCVVHCVASVLLVAFLASAGGALLDPRIHETGLALAITIGAVALGRGVRAHGAPAPLLIGACGLVLMAVGLVMPHGGYETLFTVTGVTTLAFGHYLNRRALAAVPAER